MRSSGSCSRNAARSGIDLHPEFAQIGANKLIGTSSWLGQDGKQHQRYQVLTLRGDKIADMQDCTSMRHAEQFARRQ